MTLTAPRDTEVTYRQLFAVRGIPALFGLSLANILGMSLQILTLSVLVYTQTGSALWSGLAFAAGFLPQLVGGMALTSLADRWPARRVLAGSAVLRATVAATLAAAHLPPAAAIALVATAAVVQPIPSATQSGLVSRLLSGELYVLGRSVFNLISSGSQLLGLAVGGAVVAVLGTSATFGVSAGVQLIGLVAVLGVPARAANAPAPTAPATPWRLGETWRGNLALLRDPVVRRILLSWWLPLTSLAGAESLVVAYVGGASAHTGLLLAAFPAGAAVGDLVMGRWVPPDVRRRLVPGLFALVGVALLPLAAHPATAVALACFAVASAATSYQLGAQRLFLSAVPEDRRGLAFGLFSTGIMAGQGLLPVLAGTVADGIGAGATIAVLGAFVLVAASMLGRLPRAGGEPVGARRPQWVRRQCRRVPPARKSSSSSARVSASNAPR